MASKVKTRKRGRPRSAEVDTAIERVTLELLPERGLRGLTMEEVAARAGVSKATLALPEFVWVLVAPIGSPRGSASGL